LRTSNQQESPKGFGTAVFLIVRVDREPHSIHAESGCSEVFAKHDAFAITQGRELSGTHPVEVSNRLFKFPD
jgi:hypothetical protein